MLVSLSHMWWVCNFNFKTFLFCLTNIVAPWLSQSCKVTCLNFTEGLPQYMWTFSQGKQLQNFQLQHRWQEEGWVLYYPSIHTWLDFTHCSKWLVSYFLPFFSLSLCFVGEGTGEDVNLSILFISNLWCNY